MYYPRVISISRDIMIMRDIHFYSTPQSVDLRNIIFFLHVIPRYILYIIIVIDPRTDGCVVLTRI